MARKFKWLVIQDIHTSFEPKISKCLERRQNSWKFVDILQFDEFFDKKLKSLIFKWTEVFFKSRIPETNDYHLLLATFWSKSFQGNGRFFSFEKSSSSSTAAHLFLFIPFSYADIHIANIRPKINFRKNATADWKVDFSHQ